MIQTLIKQSQKYLVIIFLIASVEKYKMLTVHDRGSKLEMCLEGEWSDGRNTD